jgi:DNA-binding GntR family transcriptional regulator
MKKLLPVQFVGVTGNLVDVLRNKIIIGELSPGEKLNEVKLANYYGISRAPLREALRVLENEKLIVTVPRKGAYVSDISLEGLNEIYQMREMIECYAIDLLEENKVRDLPKVSQSVEDASKLSVPSPEESPEDKLAYIEGLAEYHMRLVESAGNSLLFQYYQTIFSNINRYVFLNAFITGIARHRAEEHHQILSFIKQREYEQAKTVIKTHIRFACAELRMKMEKEN